MALTETRSLATPRVAATSGASPRGRARSRALGDDRDVGREPADAPASRTIPTRAEQVEPADPGERRVGLGEVLADVPERGRAEQRVGDGVAHHVAVRVAGEPLPGRSRTPPEEQRAPRRERVHVEPQARRRFSHRRASVLRASPEPRSCGVVILRFSARPSIAATRYPAHSSGARRREPSTRRRARAWASRSADARNACGVWARASASRGSVPSNLPSCTRLTVSTTRSTGTTPSHALERPERPLEQLGRRERARGVVTHDASDVGGHRREPGPHRRVPRPPAGHDRVHAELLDGLSPGVLEPRRGHDDDTDTDAAAAAAFDGTGDHGRAGERHEGLGDRGSNRSPRPAASTIATAPSTGRGYWRFANTIRPVAVLITLRTTIGRSEPIRSPADSTTTIVPSSR